MSGRAARPAYVVFGGVGDELSVAGILAAIL